MKKKRKKEKQKNEDQKNEKQKNEKQKNEEQNEANPFFQKGNHDAEEHEAVKQVEKDLFHHQGKKGIK